MISASVPTKVLFLDVDGVLNHRRLFLAGKGGAPLCPIAIRLLEEIVWETGCRIVLSSTWRTMDGFVHRLRDAGGFPGAHEDWRTIEIRAERKKGIIIPQPRGAEIAEWLSRHPEVTRYAIVDDDSDMLPEQAPYFVRTDFETGLTRAHAERLVAILGDR